jgi:hypothetical protein
VTNASIRTTQDVTNLLASPLDRTTLELLLGAIELATFLRRRLSPVHQVDADDGLPQSRRSLHTLAAQHVVIPRLDPTSRPVADAIVELDPRWPLVAGESSCTSSITTLSHASPIQSERRRSTRSSARASASTERRGPWLRV